MSAKKVPIRKVHANKSKVLVKNYKIKKDLLKNNTVVTNKLVIPNLARLPDKGSSPGQLAFNRENKTFSGWNGFEWVSLQGSGGGNGLLDLVIFPQTAISATIEKTIIQGGSTGGVVWGGRIDGVDYNITTAINLDHAVSGGSYNNSPLNIYNAGSTIPNITLPKTGYIDSLVVKWSLHGVAEWAARVSGSYNDYGNSVSTNNNGDVVMCGGYFNTLVNVYNAGGTLTNITLPNSGNMDVYIAKWDTNGDAKWAARVSNVLNDAQAYGTCINNSSDIVVSGFYRGKINIYNGDGSVAFTMYSLGDDVFTAKWNTSGMFQWATRINGVSISDNEKGTGVAQNNNGDIISTGFYTSTIEIYDWQGNVSSISLSCDGGYDAFVVKWNSSGEPQWASKIGGLTDDGAYGVAVNSYGDIVVCGYYYSSPVEIYNAGGTFSNISLPNSGYSDAFIVKWDTSGEAKWAARVAGVLDEYGNGISINDNGDIVATGYYFSNPVYVYNANGTTAFSLEASGFEDTFVVRWNSNGTAEWAARIAGIDSDLGYGVGINNLGDIVVGGGYASNILYVYDGNGVVCLTLANDSGYPPNAFIVKYPGAYQTELVNPSTNGLVKLIASSNSHVLVKPDATINYENKNILLPPSTSINMMWDATGENWIVNSLTGTLV